MVSLIFYVRQVSVSKKYCLNYHQLFILVNLTYIHCFMDTLFLLFFSTFFGNTFFWKHFFGTHSNIISILWEMWTTTTSSSNTTICSWFFFNINNMDYSSNYINERILFSHSNRYVLENVVFGLYHEIFILVNLTYIHCFMVHSFSTSFFYKTHSINIISTSIND